MIEVKKLTKNYRHNQIEQKVLRGVDLSIKEGEFVAIMGPSGAGKSTLLYQMGLLDHPTSGDILLDKVRTENLTIEERTYFRLNFLGFVFQDYALVPELTAAENIYVPLLMQGWSKKDAEKKALEVLKSVRLEHWATHLPSQLSGGEQQRVSIARAISHNPKIIFADEPTANLDSERSREIMEIFRKLNDDGQTIVMVTHEPEYAEYARRVVKLKDGEIVEDYANRK